MRVCQLVFTKNALIYGLDTGDTGISGIYRWDRNTLEVTKLADVPGVIFYGAKLSDDTIVFSSNREGAPNEQDNITRLWIVRNEEDVISIPFGTWASMRKFAKLRFQREEGGNILYISCLNIKELTDSDMLIIPENALLKIAKNKENIFNGISKMIN
jgi:hypothetical protein